MASRRAKLSPEAQAFMEMQREAWAHERRLARLSVVRDVGASFAQASAAQPLVAQAVVGTFGAGLAMAGGFLGRARTHLFASAFNRVEARGGPPSSVKAWLQEGSTLGQHPLETVGEGMMAFAGARAAGGIVTDLALALRGQAPTFNLAYDIQSPGQVEGRGGVVDPGPFEVPPQGGEGSRAARRPPGPPRGGAMPPPEEGPRPDVFIAPPLMQPEFVPQEVAVAEAPGQPVAEPNTRVDGSPIPGLVGVGLTAGAGLLAARRKVEAAQRVGRAVSQRATPFAAPSRLRAPRPPVPPVQPIVKLVERPRVRAPPRVRPPILPGVGLPELPLFGFALEQARKRGLGERGAQSEVL